jgi:hypothetical protein
MENNNPENNKTPNSTHENSEANSNSASNNTNKTSSINPTEASISIHIKNISPNSSPNSKNNFNSYTRTYDAHTTDDSDTNELNLEQSGAKQKRNNLKHKSSRSNNYYHHHHHSLNSTNFETKFTQNNNHFHSHQSQYSNFYNFKNSKNHGQSFQPHRQLVQQNTSQKANSLASQSIYNATTGAASNINSDTSSLIKPCLVHKNSLTSDEEISNNAQALNAIKQAENYDKNENKLSDDGLNQAKQGILKQNNCKNILFNENDKNDSVLIEKNSNNNSNITLTLLVDDTRFIVDPEIFKQHSNTMLGRMFNSPLENKPNERGEYVVAYGISSSIFKAVLDFYKHGIIKCPPNVSVQELKEACDYLLIPFDGTTVRCHDLRGLLNE